MIRFINGLWHFISPAKSGALSRLLKIWTQLACSQNYGGFLCTGRGKLALVSARAGPDNALKEILNERSTDTQA
ncbi:hypothetical protein [Devosia lucknowensis]|uniref:hypothetical protein n=1 Tax=Devosia lucknowensis TaxID=1096929 RepID=UPI0011210236|nr:hypothetical protein [Devosia lucknowensis]